MSKVSLYDILRNTEDKKGAYENYINTLTRLKNVPLSALIELSPICNLDCEMCYVRRTEQEIKESGHHVMRFNEWKYYIDQISEMGVPFVTLTGGECMLHPDFVEIYKYIYDHNIQIKLITNCSCMTDGIFDMFVERPPTKIFITLYGASRETYERFCKNGAAYDAVMKNVDRIIDAGFKVRLQQTIGKGNADDTIKLFEYAKAKGLMLYCSDILSVTDKCDEEKVNKAQTDIIPTRQEVENWRRRVAGLGESSETDYSNYKFPNMDHPYVYKGTLCAAGTNNFSINWMGQMKACVVFEEGLLDPRENGGVAKCWEAIVKQCEEIPQLLECQHCIYSGMCTHCVAMHYNETHEYGKVSPRLCFKIQYPEEAAKIKAEYDRRQALKAAEESAPEGSE